MKGQGVYWQQQDELELKGQRQDNQLRGCYDSLGMK